MPPKSLSYANPLRAPPTQKQNYQSTTSAKASSLSWQSLALNHPPLAAKNTFSFLCQINQTSSNLEPVLPSSTSRDLQNNDNSLIKLLGKSINWKQKIISCTRLQVDIVPSLLVFPSTNGNPNKPCRSNGSLIPQLISPLDHQSDGSLIHQSDGPLDPHSPLDHQSDGSLIHQSDGLLDPQSPPDHQSDRSSIHQSFGP